jgi:NADH dehydrogenase [ubiquinone] 1 alpha subcomplex assembly factor 7
MSALEALIKAEIAASGPMPLTRYMAHCLTHPEHGYYTSKAQVLGVEGDFITAPEISQVFGELIGLWCADMWLRAGRPNPFHLLELGPGRGILMADMLRAAGRVPGFLAAMRCHFVELSPTLQAAQRARVPNACWHTSLPQLSPALIIANEFFDVLPIAQYDALGRARSVVLDGAGALAWSYPDGAVVREVRALDFILPPMSALLAIDYGVAHIAHDTLQAVRAHQRVHPLEAPGLCDLTSHVDFGALARDLAPDLADGGHRVFGPVPQGQFLHALGLEPRTQALAGANPTKRTMLEAAAARLADPAQMGHVFKVLALCAPPWPNPAGFA